LESGVRQVDAHEVEESHIVEEKVLGKRDATEDALSRAHTDQLEEQSRGWSVDIVESAPPEVPGVEDVYVVKDQSLRGNPAVDVEEGC